MNIKKTFRNPRKIRPVLAVPIPTDKDLVKVFSSLSEEVHALPASPVKGFVRNPDYFKYLCYESQKSLNNNPNEEANDIENRSETDHILKDSRISFNVDQSRRDSTVSSKDNYLKVRPDRSRIIRVRKTSDAFKIKRRKGLLLVKDKRNYHPY
ncbi:hypothetical protein BY996DRAFT_6409516 [Phakopsora pachyrhizi]|uniref:Uncharacterized protein n=1 Tax=Phakopsora pachyrhizi TaxID=170000 RepID=A0AAV0AXJ7_PHAPC|nr:hypothetical protein BY996DRAFT_6409516 [Phakopsora pachyrhizi]CAH7673701.1 hypothetical protein PPACK8108_LOCUS8586 [Phakopsora pachyrhizi]